VTAVLVPGVGWVVEPDVVDERKDLPRLTSAQIDAINVRIALGSGDFPIGTQVIRSDDGVTLTLQGVGASAQFTPSTTDVSGLASRAELALPDASAGFGYQLSGTGTYPRDVREVFSETVRLFDFIPKAERSAILNRTSTYDASDDIERAISFCSLLPDGTELEGPRGEFLCTRTIAWKNKVRLRGKGKRATVFKFTNSGAGFKSSNPINSSTGAYSGLRNCAVLNAHAANTDGGFVDVGGTYVDLENVRVSGFKYGTIFDQTEIATIDRGEYAQNREGGIWLVNGSTYTPLAANGFTNQITVSRTQFNANKCNIIDDGGVSHNFIHNNFNGGERAMWLAGARAVNLVGNEIEYATTESIRFTGVRYSDGTGVGQCFNVKVSVNFIIANLNTPCIAFTNGTNIELDHNDYQTTGASSVHAVTGCSTVNGLIEKGGTQTGFLGILDGVPTRLFQADHPDGIRMTRAQFYSPANTDSSIETYAPSSAGGGTSIGGIDLSANNAAATKTVYAKVRPAIYGNGVGAEAGGLHIDLAVGGVPTFSYSFIASSFRPGADNTKSLGQANLRWSGVFTTALTLTPGTAPASATAAGVAGEIRVVSGFIYVCVATNTWQRTALATW